MQSYSPQRNLTCNHFNDCIVHENTCPLQVRVLEAREKLLYLPSPTFDPTIVRDQKINPAIVALSGLQGQCKLLKFQTKLAIKQQTSFMHMQMIGLLCFVILIDTTSSPSGVSISVSATAENALCHSNITKNLFRAKVLVRKYAHLEVRRRTIWVKILVQFGITS
jgi:hypothetical protein